jgi:hypothetical protein
VVLVEAEVADAFGVLRERVLLVIDQAVEQRE